MIPKSVCLALTNPYQAASLPLATAHAESVLIEFGRVPIVLDWPFFIRAVIKSKAISSKCGD